MRTTIFLRRPPERAVKGYAALAGDVIGLTYAAMKDDSRRQKATEFWRQASASASGTPD